MNKIRSRRVALLSNGVDETEAEGSHGNVAMKPVTQSLQMTKRIAVVMKAL